VSFWAAQRSVREEVRLRWEAAKKVGTTDDLLHIYESEWRRLFANVTPNAQQVIADQVLDPFTLQGLEMVAERCALWKVEVWLYVRAQMDFVFRKLRHHSGLRPFTIADLNTSRGPQVYEEFVALLARRGTSPHSAATDINSDWFKAVTEAAAEEGDIGRLVVDSHLSGGTLKRAEAIKAVAPGLSWARFAGPMTERVNAGAIYGMSIAEAGAQLVALESLCAVAAGYCTDLPDRLAVRISYRWEDVATLLRSMLLPNNPAKLTVPAADGLTWSASV
jgi:hypothetical protein